MKATSLAEAAKGEAEILPEISSFHHRRRKSVNIDIIIENIADNVALKHRND